METVKYYARFIDPHWITVVATGLYTHLRHICIIGLCFEEEETLPFDPSYASVLFVFSVLCLLAEYRLWPITLKEPPIQLLYIYEMLIAALSTNLAIRMVWIPMMQAIFCLTQESSKWLFWLNATIGLDSYSWLTTIADYMATESAAAYMAFCMSLLSFVWMLDATESLDSFLDTWSKRLQFVNVAKRRKRKNKRITFRNPENDYLVLFYDMVRLLCTIWALMLNSLRISIFQTCFANAMEDEYGYPLISSPPITTFLIATSVYVIIVNSTIFPQSFRQPKPIFMCLYEFLVTAFFLEFAIACLWTPIDVLVLSTLPKNICHTLNRLGLENAAQVLNANKSSMTIFTNGIATTILFITLHVTRAVDFQELTDNGVMYFLSHLRTKLWQRIRSELPEIKNNKENKGRRNNRRKNCNKNSCEQSR